MRAKAFLVLVLVVGVRAFAGDLATFQNLGFSPDSTVYAFSQYGVREASSLPFAELYVVDVAANRFVAGGVRTAAYDNPVEPGNNGVGALFNLLEASVELIRGQRIDHTRTGRLVYILLDGAEPKSEIEFRDFETGLRYRIVLIQAARGGGEEVQSSFHLSVTVERPSAGTSTYIVGLPDYWREGVKRYRIRQVILAPDRRSLVFVVEREERDTQGDNIRYMVETLRPEG
jgi:predicted secreted protein